MKSILIASFIQLILSNSVYANSGCIDSLYSFVKSSKNIFEKLIPGDWVYVQLENGQNFTGQFRYINDFTVIFIDTEFKQLEIKTDHILSAKIEFLGPNRTL